MADTTFNNFLKLPIDTKRILSQANLTIDNLHLRLNKCPYFNDNGKAILYQKGGKDDPKVQIDFKGIFNLLKGNTSQKDFLKSIIEKQKNSLIDLNLATNINTPLDLSPIWRFIIGLGGDSVYETSICLHHIYGIPYIPASAIKGIVHHWTLDMQKPENAEENDSLKHKITKEVVLDFFGDTKQAGKIVFFDAFPIGEIKIKEDVMNVHYQDYYRGEKDATDNQKLNPIFFLTIEETKFRFLFGTGNKNKNLLPIIESWLKKALEYKGIGAKTSVGYGYFKQP